MIMGLILFFVGNIIFIPQLICIFLRGIFIIHHSKPETGLF